MRSDVLKVISSARNVTNAVVLTHNIDFVFMQSVVLSAFRRCGHPTITIFADSMCAADSFAQQEAVLTDLGVRYRVVPVAMGTGFRFHPKAVLLTGEQEGTLFVGSGNLTFGGWRENAEVWTRFDSDSDGAGPFHAFRRYLEEVLTHVVLSEAVTHEVEEAFNPSSKSWLSTGASDDGGLIGRIGSGPPLLEQMLAVSGGDPVEELYVCSPYFDNGGIALQQLVASVGARRATILCQAGRTALRQQAWEPTAARARLQNIDYRHPGFADRVRSAFVHAKFYGLRRLDDVVVIAGSANCSRAALTLQGNVGNAELMAVRVLTPQAFEEEFLGEFYISSEPVVLPDELPGENDEEAPGTTLRILAARFEAGCLLIGYAPSSAAVTECLVDGTSAPFAVPDNGVISVSCGSDPKLVSIRARLNDKLIDSETAWIDLERQLRATAHGRSLADSFRARVQAGEWTADGWAEVLDVFCKHLAYMPAVRASVGAPRAERDSTSDGPEFTAADVFADGYQAPKIDRLWPPTGIGRDGQLHSLQHLLLRWFGIEASEPEEESDIDDGEDQNSAEVVDQPERLPTAPASDDILTDRSVRRIARIVDQLEEAMTSSQFISERSPDYLAIDLKVASALLGVGLRKGWIERGRFFELTHSIWSSLFFARAHGEVGWLEYRASVAEDTEAFVRSMRSASLSAALIGWYLAALSPGSWSPELARFTFSAALAVGRLPWLWYGGKQEDIEKELAVLLAHTIDGELENEERIRWAEAEWERLTQRGQALRYLEAAIRDARIDIIRKRIRIDELPPGEVLWQGSAGFCVVLRRCSRSGTDHVPVLKLQGEVEPANFRATATVPIRGLLDETVIPRTPDFGDVPRRVLREFIHELSKGLAEMGGS